MIFPLLSNKTSCNYFLINVIIYLPRGWKSQISMAPSCMICSWIIRINLNFWTEWNQLLKTKIMGNFAVWIMVVSVILCRWIYSLQNSVKNSDATWEKTIYSSKLNMDNLFRQRWLWVNRNYFCRQLLSSGTSEWIIIQHWRNGISF